ncbi:hypothetical protein AJ80_04255 [Polytolypa hystricis UAMH7299]|uniref:SAP domain-containing protein n=1 Tax=Polytolypa hystricis (strain UAMH7299) TaxID=1447883 RepID=A0A2B7YDE7_POLH7|nr:hypothetical protein AJ80_04255 [Polytolypa hystricis UAMH7299]
MATEYSKKTNAELIEILKSRSLPHTGKKADMVARLVEADKADTTKGGESSTASAPAPAKTTDAGGEDFIDWEDDGAPVVATATPAAGEQGQVANPTVVPNQQIDIDPSMTHDLSVVQPGTGAEQQAVEPVGDDATATAAAGEEEEEAAAAEETTEEAAAPEKPAVDYSIGLASTELDAELAKRKARAEKFGIVEDSDTALQEAQKAVDRAKRFGIEETSTSTIKGLDEALPSERPRKRGRGEDGSGGGDGGFRGGKRRDVRGGRRRGGGRSGREGNRQPQSNGNARNGQQGGGAKSEGGWSGQDRDVLERRKARFG